MKDHIKKYFRGSHASALAVDDDPTVRDAMRLCLQTFGFAEVHTAANGEEAFNIYARREKEIILVVSDLHMPKMNGDDFLRQIRLSGSKARTLLTSGDGHNLDLDRLNGEGLSGFIHKPFTPMQFQLAVLKALM